MKGLSKFCAVICTSLSHFLLYKHGSPNDWNGPFLPQLYAALKCKFTPAGRTLLLYSQIGVFSCSGALQWTSCNSSYRWTLQETVVWNKNELPVKRLSWYLFQALLKGGGKWFSQSFHLSKDSWECVLTFPNPHKAVMTTKRILQVWICLFHPEKRHPGQSLLVMEECDECWKSQLNTI